MEEGGREGERERGREREGGRERVSERDGNMRGRDGDTRGEEIVKSGSYAQVRQNVGREW